MSWFLWASGEGGQFLSGYFRLHVYLQRNPLVFVPFLLVPTSLAVPMPILFLLVHPTLFWGSPYYHLHLLSPAPSCPSWVAAYGQAEACGSVAEHFHGLPPGVGQLIASPKSPTLAAAPSPPPLEQKVLEAAVGSLRPAEEQASSMGCCSPWAVELQEVMPAAFLAFSPCWGFCSCGWQQALSLSLLW